MNYFAPQKKSYVKIITKSQNIQVEGIVEQWNDKQIVLITSSKDYVLINPSDILLTKIVNNSQHQSLSSVDMQHYDDYTNDTDDDDEASIIKLMNDKKIIEEQFHHVLQSDLPEKQKNKELGVLKNHFNQLERRIISEKLKSNNINQNFNYNLPSFFKK